MRRMDTTGDIIADLHVKVRDDGSPILLIHVFGGTGFTWSKKSCRDWQLIIK
jgi:hypothetical protein